MRSTPLMIEFAETHGFTGFAVGTQDQLWKQHYRWEALNPEIKTHEGGDMA